MRDVAPQASVLACDHCRLLLAGVPALRQRIVDIVDCWLSTC
ncbi:hypothetical protein [Serratia sp. 22264]